MSTWSIPDLERARRQEKKRHLRVFHTMTQQLLTRTEQEQLYQMLRVFQTHRQVELLVSGLCVLLNTPSKLDLFANIRDFIPAPQLALYDSLAPYHQMAHPVVPLNGSPVYQSNGTVPRRPRFLKSNASPTLTKYQSQSTPNLARVHISPKHVKHTSPKISNVKAAGESTASLCLCLHHVKMILRAEMRW